MDEVWHGDGGRDAARGQGARQVKHRRDVPLRGEGHEHDGGDVGELWIRSHAGRRLGQNKRTMCTSAGDDRAVLELGLRTWCVYLKMWQRARSRGAWDLIRRLLA
jgi:hypothetical protein